MKPYILVFMMMLGVLLLIATLVIGYKIWKQPVEASEQTAQATWEKTEKFPVLNKTFVNERIVIDGKSFSGCRFENVKMVYNGTAPFDLSKNDFFGPIIITSDKPQMMGLLIILKELKFLKDDLRIY